MGSSASIARFAEIDLALGPGAQDLQQFLVVAVAVPWLMVHEAQRTHCELIQRAQRHPCIELDMGRAGHPWMIGKARIPCCILDGQHLVQSDGMGAEGGAARDLLDVQLE